MTTMKQCYSIWVVAAVSALALMTVGTPYPAELSVGSASTPQFGPICTTSSPRHRFGDSAAGIGDLNGDGLEDFAFGSPLSVPCSGSSCDLAGVVYVIWGKLAWSTAAVWPQTATSFPNASLGLLIQGAIPDERAGTTVAGACDLNNDGIDDMMIGTQLNRIYILFGRRIRWPATFTTSQITSDQLGFTITGQGAWSDTSFGKAFKCVDYDGDSFTDILLGDEYGDSNAGKAALIYSQSAVWPSTLAIGSWPRVVNFGANDAGAHLGNALETLDLNKDGNIDLVVALSGLSTIQVIWGGKSLVSCILPATDPSFGWRFVDDGGQWGQALTTGDYDGDSNADLAFSSSSATQVIVVLASATRNWTVSSSSEQIYLHDDFGESFGTSLASGDLNGDDYDDLFIGAPGFNDGIGKIYVVFGASGLSSMTFSESTSPEGLTWSLITGSLSTHGQLGTSVGAIHAVYDVASAQLVGGAPSGNNDAGVGYLVKGETCIVAEGSTCYRCFVGYGLTPTGTCSACTQGKTYSNGRTPCIATLTATHCVSFTQAGTCLKCNAGSELKYGECIACTDNTWSNGTTECQACHIIHPCTSCNPSNEKCNQCDAGFGLNTAAETCTQCDGSVNQWSDGTTACVSGPTHCLSCNAANKKCLKCSAGFSLSSSGSCTACTTPTTWSTDGNATQCKSCSAGIGGSKCVECVTTTGICTKCSSNDFIIASGTCTQQYEIVLDVPANTTINTTQLAVEIGQVLGVEPTQIRVTIQVNPDTGKVVAVVLLPDNVANVETTLNNIPTTTTTTKWLRFIETVKRLRSETGNLSGSVSLSTVSFLVTLLLSAMLLI